MFFSEDYFLSLKVLCTSNIFDVHINFNEIQLWMGHNGFCILKNPESFICVLLNCSLFFESLMTSSLTNNFKLQENISFHSYNDMVIRVIIMTTVNKYFFCKRQFAKNQFWLPVFLNHIFDLSFSRTNCIYQSVSRTFLFVRSLKVSFKLFFRSKTVSNTKSINNGKEMWNDVTNFMEHHKDVE